MYKNFSGRHEINLFYGQPETVDITQYDNCKRVFTLLS
jgi:hypothetical protein